MSYKVKDILKSERPRERLLSEGADKLSNEELLSIIIKTGTFNKNVKDISVEILNKYNGINNLKNMKIENLKEIKGIGEVKAIELIATVELGKRIFLSNNLNNKKRLVNAKDIWINTKYLFFDKKQEYFYALYFNNKQELIDKKLLFIGTINRSVVHPRELFKEAYLLSASSIVCMHNHPSGDINPSREDINFTNSIYQIGKLQGIPVLDHIIVSNNSYYSFYENKNIFMT